MGSSSVGSGRAFLGVVGGAASSTGQGRRVVHINNKTPCHDVLGRVCPKLHGIGYGVSCAIIGFSMRRKHVVVHRGPGCLDLGRVCRMTGDCPGNDGSFIGMFSVTMHVCPASRMTGLGTTTITLSRGSLGATIGCVRGTSRAATRFVGGAKICGFLGKSVRHTVTTFRRTTGLNGRTTRTGLGRLRRVLGIGVGWVRGSVYHVSPDRAFIYCARGG